MPVFYRHISEAKPDLFYGSVVDAMDAFKLSSGGAKILNYPIDLFDSWRM